LALAVFEKRPAPISVRRLERPEQTGVSDTRGWWLPGTGSARPARPAGAPSTREAPFKQVLFGPLQVGDGFVLALEAQNHQEGVSKGQLCKARGQGGLKVPHFAGGCIKFNIGCPSQGRINGIGDADGLRTSGPAQSKAIDRCSRA